MVEVEGAILGWTDLVGAGSAMLSSRDGIMEGEAGGDDMSDSMPATSSARACSSALRD